MSAILAMEVQDPLIGGMSEGRLEFHMDNWRRWMRCDDVTTGAPNKAAGCVGGGYSQSFDDMADASDVRCAMIVDALVSSLTHIERAAVNHKYLYAVFRFHHQASFESTLQRARTKLAEWLVARGVY